MRLKNILIAFSFIVVAMGFYSLSNRPHKPVFMDSEFNDLSIQEQTEGLSNFNYSNNKKNKDRPSQLNKLNSEYSKKINRYKEMVQKRANAQPEQGESDASVDGNDEGEEVSENQEDEENTASNDEDSEENDGEEEGKDENSKEFAKKDSPVKKAKNKIKDYKSIVSSSQDDRSFYIASNTPVVTSNQVGDSAAQVQPETLDSTDEVSNGGITNPDTSDPVAGDDNDRLADIDLSELEVLIDENDYSAVQEFLNSSSLSSFRRASLRVLVISSFSQGEGKELESIITANYFSGESLSLYTLSMIQAEYSFEERVYMADLLKQEIYSAPGRLTKNEFIETYFNGVRVHLPTPNNTSDMNLADLYLSVDSSIEESFATYSSNSQIASDQ